MNNFEVKSNFELKDVDEKTGMVTGYASIFNNIDSDKDMILPGAFLKTLTERGPESSRNRIKHLWQHDSWQPIGVPKVLKEDDRGLYFESQFGKDQFSQDKLQQHIDGIITELSIGFNTIKSDEIRDNEQFQYRKLKEIRLWEYSSVTWGANSLTEVISAKSDKTDILAELNKRIDALNKALKNGKYTEESAEQFEAELSKIQSIIKTLDIKEPDHSTPKPEPSMHNNLILETILKALKNE